VQIRNVSFDELPTEIKEIAEKEIGHAVDFLNVTIFDYGNGSVDYTVSVLDESFVTEMHINNKRGVEDIVRISINAVRYAIEKFPERFGLN
jgi:hypothetical protein